MFFTKVPTVSWRDVPKGSSIIDVREIYEYRIQNINGTKNVPLSKIESLTSNNKIYVMCQSGMRSKRAVKILRKNGVDAVNIKGGLNAYGK